MADDLDTRIAIATRAVEDAVSADIRINGEQIAGASPASLRVGINVTVIEARALFETLVDAGVIDPSALRTRIAEMLEAEMNVMLPRIQEPL